MALNAILATIPAVIAVLVFHRRHPRSLLWWSGVVVFLLFLPNAPYVVTDLIHAGGLVQRYSGRSDLAPLVPLGAIGLLVTYGLAAYALCLAEVDRALVRSHRGRWRVPVHAALHLLSAFGVVLGRLPRLNSWYVFTRPEAVVDGLGEVSRPLVVPLVLVLAVAFALGAAAVGAVGRAAFARVRSLGPAQDPGDAHLIEPA